MSDSCEPNADRESVRSREPSGAEEGLIPDRGRLLGLDFGTRRIGVALCDDDRRIASPLENYTLVRREVDAHYLQRVVQDYRPVGLVVGLPLHMSGDEGEKAKEARRFGAWASSVTGLPAVFWDERLTSTLAEDFLRSAQLSPKKRKARLDKVAAQIMLQSYLDKRILK